MIAMFLIINCFIILSLLTRTAVCLENYVSEGMRNLFVKETCNGEVFEPDCSDGKSVVLMTRATYGRMEVGKCISQEEVADNHGQNPKYFGCSSNVLDILHKKCSMKQGCNVLLPDSDMDKTKPCFPGLRSYLHAEYKCINVIEQKDNCLIQATESPKYLAVSQFFTSSGCGFKPNSWVVEAPKGQKIQIHLENLEDIERQTFKADRGFEFGYVSEHSYSINNNKTLYSTGRIISNQKNSLSDEHKYESVYVSIGSVVELNFAKNKVADLETDRSLNMVLLKIETSGCLDIIPPEDTWLKRNNDDIVVGCYSSKQTWYLRCENRRWSGVVGNCSTAKHLDSEIDDRNAIESKNSSITVTEEQQMILFVAICFLGLLICLTIVCVGAICIKKFSWKAGATNVYSKQPLYYPGSGQYIMNRHIPVSTQLGQPNCTETQGIGVVNQSTIKYDEFDKTDENKYFILETDAK